MSPWSLRPSTCRRWAGARLRSTTAFSTPPPPGRGSGLGRDDDQTAGAAPRRPRRPPTAGEGPAPSPPPLDRRCPGCHRTQVLARLTDRRIAVEKELSALGEAKKGANDIFRHCRGFERAYSIMLQVRRRGLPPGCCRPAVVSLRFDARPIKPSVCCSSPAQSWHRRPLPLFQAHRMPPRTAAGGQHGLQDSRSGGGQPARVAAQDPH